MTAREIGPWVRALNAQDEDLSPHRPCNLDEVTDTCGVVQETSGSLGLTVKLQAQRETLFQGNKAEMDIGRQELWLVPVCPQN